MVPLKSVLAGVNTAVFAVLAWVALSLSIEGGGGRRPAAAFEIGMMTLFGVVGFIVGFWLHRELTGRRR